MTSTDKAVALVDELRMIEAACSGFSEGYYPGVSRQTIRATADALEAQARELATRQEVRCDGCGSSWTDADLARERATRPGLVSCCPERKPLTIDEWRELAIAARAEIERLREALKPFAGYFGPHYPDTDNRGVPLADDDGVGWIYLTVGDFRRARSALAKEEA